MRAHLGHPVEEQDLLLGVLRVVQVVRVQLQEKEEEQCLIDVDANRIGGEEP